MHTLPLLLHSVSYSGSWGQAALSLEQVADKAAAFCFDGVMLMAKRPHLSPLDWDAARRRQLRDHLAAAGLRHNVLAGYTNFTADLEHAEIPQREMQIHYVEALSQLGADLGAPAVRIFTGYEHRAASFSAQWRMIADALSECAHRAGRLGVTLLLQSANAPTAPDASASRSCCRTTTMSPPAGRAFAICWPRSTTQT